MIALAATAFLSSCEKEETVDPVALKAPVLTVAEQTETSFMVIWDLVENAVSYTYTINDGAEENTTNQSAEFTDLTEGTYTVKVKAIAPEGDEYLDSDWASINVTLEVAGPEQLAAPQLSIAEQTSSSFVISWSDVENAVSYAYTLNAGSEETTEDLSVEFTDLAVGDYEVQVKAVGDGEDFLDSDWASITVSIEEPVEPVEALKAWFGTYEVTSTNTISHYSANNTIVSEYTGEPSTFNITIEAYEGEDSVAMVTGWCAWNAEMPGFVQLLPDGSLALLSNVNLGDDGNGQGINMYWTVYAELYGLPGYEDGSFSSVTGCPYGFIFVNDGTQITSTPYEGELNGGGTFKVVGLDVFGYDGQYTYFYNLPWEMPAGDFTLVKTGEGSSSSASVKDLKGEKVAPISVYGQKAVAAR